MYILQGGKELKEKKKILNIRIAGGKRVNSKNIEIFNLYWT